MAAENVSIVVFSCLPVLNNFEKSSNLVYGFQFVVENRYQIKFVIMCC